MRRIGTLAAALLAALAAAVVVPATAASQPAPAGTPVLSQYVPGGPPVNPGDYLRSSLTPGTTLNFTTDPGGPVGLFCKQSTWIGQAAFNPPAPGTAVIKLLNPLSIDACYDNAPTVTGVAGVMVSNLPSTMTVSDTPGFPIEILPSTGPLTLSYTVSTTSSPAVTCVFQAGGPVVGATGLGGVPWQFTNQPFKLVSGSLPACGKTPTAYLTAGYSPVQDVSAGGTTVYVN